MSGVGGTLRPGARTVERRATYKKTIDSDESRRKREDAQIQLRKEKKDDALQKKRRETLPSLAMTPAFGMPGGDRGAPVRVRGRLPVP